MGVDTGMMFLVRVDVFIGGTVKVDGFSFDDLYVGNRFFEGDVGVFVE
jgi:hypothetical protein